MVAPEKQHFGIFGIRHHGAGSSKRLVHALEEFKPDAIAIELPEESKNLIPIIDEKTCVPPIAFLFYNADNPDHSIYLPLAVFSPEYQAILYAKKNNIPIHCIDLPASVSLVNSNFREDTEQHLNKKQRSITRDPIGYLAKQAGYSDSERWWENHFEQWHDDVKLFDFVNDLMFELRKQSHGRDDEETLIREQFMRLQLRQILKKRYKRIAIICGAWHGPVLTQDFIEKSADEIIKPLKTIEIKTCIIPWTYKNISLQTGYSAGIISPIWHEAMFENPESASSRFLVKAVQLLRREGIDLSPSSAIDAELLANNMALLRDLPSPGIEELLDSSVCIFGRGNSETIDWLKDKILCGEVTGKIELKSQNLPFVKSFHATLKNLRLSRFWKDGHAEELDLDLRKENQLKISQFLHFTQLIEMNWASTRTSDINALGNFHEYWSFHWHPELEIYLIQIALYGNTFKEAAAKYIQKKLSAQVEIYRIAQFLEHSLKSGFRELLPVLSEKLSGIILQNPDVVQLSTMIRPLMSGLEYGSIHQTDVEFIRKVLDELIPKLVISYPESIKFVDYNKSKQLMQALLVLQLYFDKYKSRDADDLYDLWKHQLNQMADDELSHPLLKGKIWNILLERKFISLEAFLISFNLQFSLHSDIPKAAHWFEGFLYNQSAFYLMHPDVMECLDKWLLSIDEFHFKDNLPLLRRVFDQISVGERQRIFSLIANRQNSKNENYSESWTLDESRKNKMNKLIERILRPA
jgi:hypothetical protein